MGRNLFANFVLGRMYGILPMAPKGRRCVGDVDVECHRLDGSSFVLE